MTTERQATCDQRIDEHMVSRLESIGALVKISQADSVDDVTDAELSELTNMVTPDRDQYEGDRGADNLRDEARERMYELPLSVETLKVVKVLLSTGGPGDWFEAHIDEDGDFRRIEYWFNDWFDSAHRVLNGDEYDTAAEFIRQVAGIE